MCVVYISALHVLLCNEESFFFFVRMSYTQKTAISPCLPEVGSWKLSFLPYLYSVKADCFHQLLYSKSFSSNLCLLSPILEEQRKALTSLLCWNAGVRSESRCFGRVLLPSVCVYTGQHHPYTTNISFLFVCVIPLCKFSIFFFLIPLH